LAHFALVLPWFGPDLKGGAEQQAWQIATRLRARGHRVEVLTTCCESFMRNWGENHLPAGLRLAHGLLVRRFPVDPRHGEAMDALCQTLWAIPPSAFKPGVPPVDPAAAAAWTRENINSTALIQYLQSHQYDYDAIILLPYLYGVVTRAVAALGERAWLQPCLHDECYAYLPEVAAAFFQAGRLLFNSLGEMAIATRLYGPMVAAKGVLVSEGVEFESLPKLPRERLPAGLKGRRYFLCLGRRDATKNVDFLVAAWRAVLAQMPADVDLVLAGPGHQSYAEPTARIHDLELVDADTKAALLQHALALTQPSLNESFSRVLFEAWYLRRPAIVHGLCPATALATRAAAAGLTPSQPNEWQDALRTVAVASATQHQAWGEAARTFALTHADWDRVMDRYEALRAPPTPPLAGFVPGREVIQFSAGFANGDAISNHIRWIRDRLREVGIHSRIVAIHIDPGVGRECEHFRDARWSHEALAIYHHSIGSDVTRAVIDHAGPKALIYHNITPARYFAPWRPHVAEECRIGRAELPALAPHFPVSCGVSRYNADELAAIGFAKPSVVPLPISPAKWRHAPDPVLARELADGAHNLLFVGRNTPNKCPHQLITVFEEYCLIEPDARLIIVGGGDIAADPYVQFFYRRRDVSPVAAQIVLANHVDEPKLAAYYQQAHAFVSLSEHEGFCAPLIEAMWWDVPVVAYRSSAIPETLGDAGVLLTHKHDPQAVARAVHRVITDVSFRAEVIERQRARREVFLDAPVAQRLQAWLTSALPPADVAQMASP
jgi:glycosyltransferase involved in cell wall biosynthesis